jgi:diazepam-binding inhibitor (GABA receptor modulating acyl-CoA-binding protein)
MAATPKKGAKSTAPAAKGTAAAQKTPAGSAKAAAKPAVTPAAADDLRTRFESAAAAAKQTKQRPDNATMLKLYSHYKQATEGDVQGARPGGFDFVGAAKYDAWAKLKGTTRDDAMQAYIRQVERLNRE